MESINYNSQTNEKQSLKNFFPVDKEKFKSYCQNLHHEQLIKISHNNLANTAILCRALARVGQSVESRNAFKDEGFHSIQLPHHVTQSTSKM